MKNFQRFFLSSLVFSLLAAHLSFADENPLQARKPGQPEAKTVPTSPSKTSANPNLVPKNKPVRYRVTSEPTGVAHMRNYVGIVTEPVPASLAAQLSTMLKSGQGVGVKHVLSGSPAEQAGIKIFDVLTTYNGKAITSSDVLRKFVLGTSKGSTVNFGVIRSSQQKTIEVTLTQKLYRHYKFSVKPVGKNQNLKNQGPNKSKSDEPEQEGPIAVRSTESDPLGRKTPLGFSHIPVTTTHNLCLLYVGNAKTGHSVKVSYQDPEERIQTHHFKGNPKEIRHQIIDLPDHVQMMINERLKELQMALKGKGSFRFQVKGHMQGKNRFVRVFLSRPTKDRSVRMVELDQHIGTRPALNVNQILGNQVFTKEMNQLTPDIQGRIRATLQRIRVNSPQVRVDNPI